VESEADLSRSVVQTFAADGIIQLGLHEDGAW
jgi:hypothetical protein